MRQLKTDIHIHTAEDPIDRISYSARQLIRDASRLGYEVLAITNHNALTYDNELQEYARQYGILLIPGVEASIEKKHVLLYNMAYSPDKIRTFADLRRLKTADSLVIAPHPFFPMPASLQRKLVDNLDLFDGIEYCHFYFSWLNFNHRGVQLASEKKLPLIGTSDAHMWWQFHTTYSLVRGEKSVAGVIQAIKQGRIEVVSSPLSLRVVGKMGLILPYQMMLELMAYSGMLGKRWAERRASRAEGHR
jgi:predicted metal-dependent phosphoesterase TrpH